MQELIDVIDYLHDTTHTSIILTMALIHEVATEHNYDGDQVVDNFATILGHNELISAEPQHEDSDHIYHTAQTFSTIIESDKWARFELARLRDELIAKYTPESEAEDEV